MSSLDLTRLTVQEIVQQIRECSDELDRRSADDLMQARDELRKGLASEMTLQEMVHRAYERKVRATAP